MTIVPVPWREPFAANLSPAPNSAPALTQLANGNVLIVWTAGSDTGPGGPPGNDVLGQIVDPFGNRVGAEIRLNILRTLHDEESPAIVPLADGGFAVGYAVRAPQVLVPRPPPLAPTLRNDGAVVVETFAPDGAHLRSTTLIGATTAETPELAILPDQTIGAVWVRPGSADVLFSTLNPATGTASAPVLVFDGNTGTGEGIGGVSIAALPGSGRFAVVHVDRNAGADDTLHLSIFDAAGQRVPISVPVQGTNLTTSVPERLLATAPDIRNPHVSVFPGGNEIVVTWTAVAAGGDADVRVMGAGSTGGAVLEPFSPVASTAGTQDHARFVGLPGGDFLVFWYDAPTADLLGARFLNNGTVLRFRVADHAPTSLSPVFRPGDSVSAIEARLLEDGRVALVYALGTALQEPASIRTVLLDPRTLPNATPASGYVVGTPGNDDVTLPPEARFVHLAAGDDTLRLPQDRAGAIGILDGGAGTDTLVTRGSGLSDLTGARMAGIERLAHEFLPDQSDPHVLRLRDTGFAAITAVAFDATRPALGETVEILLGETQALSLAPRVLTGTSAAKTFRILGDADPETVTGSALADAILGEGGNDSLRGEDGDDTLAGGAGDDTLDGGAGGDSLDGGPGNDLLRGGAGNDTLLGQAGNDTLQGDTGDDTLDGGAGGDSLDGGPGNDLLRGGAEDDVLLGQDGDDTLQGDGGNDTLLGHDGNDSLAGGAGNDTLLGGTGADTLDGGTGDDSLDGGPGDDLLRGGEGHDVLLGGEGADTLEGGAGNDTLHGDDGTGGAADRIVAGGGEDLVYAGAGDDSVAGEDGNDTIAGGAGNDTLDGGAGDDSIVGEDGADLVLGGAGRDTLFGDADADTIRGGADDDLVFGGAGADSLFGDAGNDRLEGGAGDDALDGGEGNDTLLGDAGNDRLSGGNGADSLLGGAGRDTLSGGEGGDILAGGTEDDSLEGGAGNDRLLGEDGNDTLRGGDGADTLNGGAGDDLIFGGDTAADLRDVIFGGDGNDTLDGGAGNDEMHGGTGDDILFGEAGADTLIGNAGRDTITGGALADEIYGGPGDDFLNGGFGFDRLNGGAGADTFFHLGVADHGSDWIQDYSAAEGDILQAGIAGATRGQFQVNIANTPNAGRADVAEAFVIYRPTGQILFALVDGAGQASITLRLGAETFDLLA